MENNPGDSSSQKSDKSIMQTVDLLSLSNQTPILRGHVFKQSSDRFRHKYDLLSFKKRYFVLYKGVLLYYVHESNFEKDLHRKLVRVKMILMCIQVLQTIYIITIWKLCTLSIPIVSGEFDSSYEI